MKELKLLELAIVRFAIVGSFATAIDLSTYFLLIQLTSLGAVASNIGAFLVSLLISFSVHSRWTFRYESKRLRRELIKFVIVATIGVMLSTLIIFALVNNGLSEITAKLISILAISIWNFQLNKIWTFKPKPKIPQSYNELLDLSVVVPAYNEEKRITKTVQEYHEFLSQNKLTFEIIVVNDGSKDNTARVISQLAKTYEEVHGINLPFNQGKGKATQTGMLEAQARLVLLADADHSTPIEEVITFMTLCDRDNYDVVIGSRHEEQSKIVKNMPLRRQVVSRLGNIFLQFILLPGIKDTQCGFKLFKNRVAKEIFSRLKIKRFGFDVEVLVIAKLHNCKIAVQPVKWNHDERSTVREFSNTLNFFKETMLIFINKITGRYN